MNIWLWVMTLLYLLALAGLLVVARRRRSWYAAAKGICSGLFLVCALVAWFTGTQRAAGVFWQLWAALLLCALGDVLLGVANRVSQKVDKLPFVVGAISFTLAHVLFCVLYYHLEGFRWYDLVLPLVLMLVLYLLEKTDKVRLKKIRPLGYVYTFVVALMVTKALELLATPALAPEAAVRIAIGAMLFLCSDVVLLFLYFGTKKQKWLRGLNLLSYYAGLWLLALSATWL